MEITGTVFPKAKLATERWYEQHGFWREKHMVQRDDKLRTVYR